MKLALHMRTSSVASHGGGGQYTCDTAEADRSMTPDHPHADGRRGPVSPMRTHRQQHRAAVCVPRWNARRRESAGSKSKVCTCTETWVTRAHNARAPAQTDRTWLHINLICKACDLKQQRAHVERMKQGVCNLIKGSASPTRSCARRQVSYAPGLGRKKRKCGGRLEGPSIESPQLLLPHTPPANTKALGKRHVLQKLRRAWSFAASSSDRSWPLDLGAATTARGRCALRVSHRSSCSDSRILSDSARHVQHVHQ